MQYLWIGCLESDEEFKKKAKRDEYKKGSCVSVSFDDFDDLIL